MAFARSPVADYLARWPGRQHELYDRGDAELTALLAAAKRRLLLDPLTTRAGRG
jgi:hypothetical protein